VAGADGCRGGWLVAVASSGRRALSAERLPDLEPVFARLAAGQLAALAVDIPIGLSGAGPRRCDAEARRLLGPRRSSVFPAPARAALGASCHAQASALNQQAGGKRLSLQSLSMLGRIGHVEHLVRRHPGQVVAECHPELSFCLMAGAPMAHPKRTAAGRTERLDALRAALDGIDAQASSPLFSAHPDDLLDAFACAWSAARLLAGEATVLGGDLDPTGLPMRIVA